MPATPRKATPRKKPRTRPATPSRATRTTASAGTGTDDRHEDRRHDDRKRGREKDEGGGFEGEKGGEEEEEEAEDLTVVAQIPVGLTGVDTSARPRRHLVGVRGANMFHIQDITGTPREVCGQEADGSFEFVVSGSGAVRTDKAVELCKDLIKNVVEDLRND